MSTCEDKQDHSFFLQLEVLLAQLSVAMDGVDLLLPVVDGLY